MSEDVKLKPVEIEVTFRDLYQNGTETVVLMGEAAKKYLKAADKSQFLSKLETVSFKNPYVIKEK